MLEVDRNNLPLPLDAFVLADLLRRLEFGEPIDKDMGEMAVIELHRLRYRGLDMIAELAGLRTILAMADSLLDGESMDEIKLAAKKMVGGGLAKLHAANDQSAAMVRDLVIEGNKDHEEDDCA